MKPLKNHPKPGRSSHPLPQQADSEDTAHILAEIFPPRPQLIPAPSTFLLEFSSQAHQHEVQMIPSRIRNPTPASNTSELVFPPAPTERRWIPQLCRDGTGCALSWEQVLTTPALCHCEGSGALMSAKSPPKSHIIITDPLSARNCFFPCT